MGEPATPRERVHRVADSGAPPTQGVVPNSQYGPADQQAVALILFISRLYALKHDNIRRSEAIDWHLRHPLMVVS